MPRKPTVATKPAKASRAVKAAGNLSHTALLDRFKDYAPIALIQRQLSNPGDPGSVAILLKDESPEACVNSDHQWRLKPGATKCHACGRPARIWHVRTINTTIENRWSSVKNRGYVPVRRSEIVDHDDIAGLVEGTADDYIRRGDAGKEILMKRPLELHLAIKREQHARLNANMNSKKHIAKGLAEAAGSELGDEAGQMIHDGGIQIESMKRQKRPLGQEIEESDAEDAIDEA
jgi:hypothetical protein